MIYKCGHEHQDPPELEAQFAGDNEKCPNCILYGPNWQDIPLAVREAEHVRKHIQEVNNA